MRKWGIRYDHADQRFRRYGGGQMWTALGSNQ